MSITRAELRRRVLSILNKKGGYQGFFDDDKINDMIQDSLDYISIKSGFAGDGWQVKIMYLTPISGSRTLALPEQVALVQEIRYLVSNVYIPLMYDDASRQDQSASSSGVTQYPATYRLVDGSIYWNPAPYQADTNGVEIEYFGYPAMLSANGQQIGPQFDRTLLNYAKWRTASQLVSSVGKGLKEWEKYEDQWEEAMSQLIHSRLRSPVFVKDFEA